MKDKILKNQSPFKNKKKKPGKLKKFVIRSLVSIFFIVLITSFIGGWILYSKYSKGLPDVLELRDYSPSTITKVFSDTDELIAEFYIEKRILIPLSKIPLRLKQATLAVEDSNFYHHFGIDPKAIFRAFLTNLKAGHVVEGGSTITQQLTKTLFLSFEKSFKRKIQEAILAIRLELVFTKDEILEMYLNQIYYGHGSYGVESAARTYFGKKVGELGISECATIAALPKAPNHYSPYRDYKKAFKRRNHVIRRMASLGFISEKEKRESVKEEIKLQGEMEKLNRAPYFTEYIRQFIQEKYGSNKLYRDGLEIHTTLDINAQENAQKAIKTGLKKADKRYGYRGPEGKEDFKQDLELLNQKIKEWNKDIGDRLFQEGDIVKGIVTDVSKNKAKVYLGRTEGLIFLESMEWARKPNIKLDGKRVRIKSVKEALSSGDIVWVKMIKETPGGSWELELEQDPEVQSGLISLDPYTGHIKAMVGGYDFTKSQFNRATQAIRQPGSAFKPIIFAAGLEDGYTPASIIIDSPVIFKEKEDTFDKWKPVNFEKKFFGPTSIRTALTHSRNVVTIKLLQNIGVYKAIEVARKLGIESHLDNNLSIALGSSGMTLFEIVSAYAVFANQGQRIEPTPVRFIKNRKDEIIFSSQPETEQVFSPGLAYLVTSLLESVVKEGTGMKVRKLGRPVAAKTGTTNNYIDAWFIGYTPELVTGVWVGKDRDESLGVNETGSRAAIPIWLKFMEETLRGRPVQSFPIPQDIKFTKINPKTGLEASFNDEEAIFEAFLDEKAPDKNIESLESSEESF